MTVRRVMGIETEYGLIEPGNAWANPVEMSTRIVRAYAAGVPHAPWDYAGEDPLSDARGYRLGYGGGYYDRSIAEIRAAKPVITIGLAYDELEVDAVPHDAYDQRLDWVLTPSGPRKCRSD